MEDFIIILLLAAFLGVAGHYIYKKKKAGVKCIGCPCEKTCSGGCRNKKQKI